MYRSIYLEGQFSMHMHNAFFFHFPVFDVLRSGICADIAVSKHEHWSSLAILPFEIVISAGQKTEESRNAG